MKRYLYLFPLMAFTAATLTLGACDDKKKEDQAQSDQTAATAPADTSAAPAQNDAMTATTPTTATAPAVQAEGANAYATAEGATTGAVFLTLHNSGTDADKLTGVKTDAASSAEIHESYVDDQGTMQMRKVDGVDIGAGQQVTFKPDGYHIMLTGLTKPLVEGQTFNVTLTFEKAPEVTLPVTITAAGAPSASGTDTMDHSSMDHDNMGTTDSTSSSDAGAGTPDVTPPPSTDESAQPSETESTPSTTTPAPSTGDAPGTTTDSAPSDDTSGNGATAQ